MYPEATDVLEGSGGKQCEHTIACVYTRKVTKGGSPAPVAVHMASNSVTTLSQSAQGSLKQRRRLSLDSSVASILSHSYEDVSIICPSRQSTHHVHTVRCILSYQCVSDSARGVVGDIVTLEREGVGRKRKRAKAAAAALIIEALPVKQNARPCVLYPSLVELEQTTGQSGMLREQRMVVMVQERVRAIYGEVPSADLRALCPETAVVAAFIQSDGSNLSVISLATGTKTLSQEHRDGPADGRRLIDSHAEVLARRALFRYLVVAMIAKDVEGQDSIFRGGRLRDGVEFHLYVSTAPCGDSRRFIPVSGSKRKLVSALSDDNHCPDLASIKHRNAGQLSTKITAGEGYPAVICSHLATRRASMTCSDKVLKWAVCGLQGSALFSALKQPVKLSSVVIGGSDSFDKRHLVRDLCCRAPGGCLGLKIALVPKPAARFSNARSVLCINWVQGESPGTEITHARKGRRANLSNQAREGHASSRLCKAVLAEMLVKKINATTYSPGETYLQWKQRIAHGRPDRKTLDTGCGSPWVHFCKRHSDFPLNF